MGLFTGERYATEDTVENHLKKVITARGGYCIKLMVRSWPDRLVLLPGGVIAFVELKRPKGGKYEPLQVRRHDRLRELGFTVLVLNTKRLVDIHFKE